MMQIRLLFFFLLSSSMLCGQESHALAFYADVMVNAEVAAHRVEAMDRFQPLLRDMLLQAGSFDNELEELPFVFVRYPEDRSFRTITWQVDQGKGKYHYGGIWQQDDGSIIELNGKSGRRLHSSTGSANWANWSGAIIYKILQIEENYYLLCYKQLDQYTKIKTVEQVSHTDDGGVELGQDGAFGPEGNQSRLILKYSADANCSIKYYPESKRIVYDHLSPMAGRIPGQGPSMAPDGSYEAYELQTDGTWKYIDKVYNQVNETPPQGGISTSEKDLFGRKRN
ncbi:MAG: hypothetical protein AAFR14_10295 [Bacteroidota bacterium]